MPVIDSSALPTGPGKFGTICSFIILMGVMILTIFMDAYVANRITFSYWTEGCPDGKDDICKENGFVFRASFALVIMFAVQFIGTFISSRFYDNFWFEKFLVFAGFFILFIFLPADVFDTNGYAWFARLAAFLFLILQQVILIDFAYTWNEKWVQYSQEEGGEEGGGGKWLAGLLLFSFIFYGGSWSVIGVLYWQFDQCVNNTVILSLTVVFTTLTTIFQVGFTSEGSLITSAVMTAYATYICYAALLLNPSSYCNPTIATGDEGKGYRDLSEAIGIFILVLSLAWTTYSTVSEIPGSLAATSSHNRPTMTSIMSGGGDKNEEKKSNADAGEGSAAGGAGTGLAVTSGDGNATDEYKGVGLNNLLMQVAIIFLLISAYFAMVLTNWATIDGAGSNNRQGFAAMWLQVTAQWIALLMYGWSLVAPMVLTDREFSR